MLNRFLEVVPGDTLSFKIVVKDGVSPIDLTNVTFTGGVKQAGSERLLAEFNSFTTGPGTATVMLSPAQTATLPPSETLYEWYVRLESPNYKKTLCFGGLRVVRV